MVLEVASVVLVVLIALLTLMDWTWWLWLWVNKFILFGDPKIWIWLDYPLFFIKSIDGGGST